VQGPDDGTELAQGSVNPVIAQQSGGKRELMIVGDDDKVTWEAAGKSVFLPPGKDTVSVIDIGTDPLEPKILANLPLINSIFGPPTNLAITPDGKLAITADNGNAGARARGGPRDGSLTRIRVNG